MKKLFTVFMLLIIIGSGVSRAVDRCEICRKELTGQYYTYEKDGHSIKICQECVNVLGRCKMCGIPVRNTRKNDPNVLCRTCKLNAKKCSICGSTIIGRYYSDNKNHFYCETCYAEADRCALCKNILHPGEWSYTDGKKICNTCLRDRPRCKACGKIISSKYSQYTGFDGTFCPDCVQNSPTCISCMCPCGPDPVRLANGNAICRDCYASAIQSKRQLESIVSEVARYMERNLLMRIETPIDFKMVDFVDYSKNSGQYRESGRFIRIGNDYSIKILTGLSRPLCIETVAHELAHAWQAENCPFLPSDELIEGFAQWVAGKTLAGFGHHELIKRLDSRVDVYGRGFRRINEMEKSKGFSGVFRELIRLGNPPK